MGEIIQPRLMSAKQAAKYLSVSERTIANLVSDNVIPSLKIQRLRRFDKRDLDAFIQAAKGDNGHG